MSELTVIICGVGMFISVVLLLVAIILLARLWLVPSGNVKIMVNEDPDGVLEVPAGGKLLNALADQGVFLSSACGGQGTCAQCKVRVLEGGGDILPTELDLLSRREAREQVRLSCQVGVKQDMVIEVPPEAFSAKKWDCEVVSNRNVATFIKEFVVRLPEGEVMDFEPGGYVQLHVPPFECRFRDMDVQEPFRSEWDRFGLWDLEATNRETVVRAYSMANHPAEGNIVMLNIRIAAPPFDRQKGGWMDVPPGIASSYVFSRKPGDMVTVAGAFGEFFIQETDREMVYIGGGAGMAPLRSHILHLFRTLRTERRVSYWYGARSLKELFYREDFQAIEREFPNFSFHLAMSDPQPEDEWTGSIGFIHQVVLEEYLGSHPAPEDVEYYLCGPPMMLQAVLSMLDDLGVEREMIRFDDFGS